MDGTRGLGNEDGQLLAEASPACLQVQVLVWQHMAGKGSGKREAHPGDTEGGECRVRHGHSEFCKVAFEK